jgi:ribosomal-protein-alanine N-acetyltransferase
MGLDSAFTELASLATERLHLRPTLASDAEALFLVKSDMKITKRYGHDPHRTVDQTRDWLRQYQLDYQQRKAMMWSIVNRSDGQIIGECCLWNFGPEFHYAELGYELHSSYWKRGLMTEALQVILAFGFMELELHRIEANPLETNTPSQKVLINLGFKHEATLRQRYHYEGHFLDELYYGLLRSEWMDRSNLGRSIDGSNQV